METVVFKSGNSQAVRLPKGFDLPCGKVSLRREGERIIIEPYSESWPDDFFEAIRIERESFGRESLKYDEKTL